jgi:hypothetical protein
MLRTPYNKNYIQFGFGHFKKINLMYVGQKQKEFNSLIHSSFMLLERRVILGTENDSLIVLEKYGANSHLTN